MIRALEPGDWQTFREIRLQALRGDPGFFFAPLSEEAALPPAEWQKRLERTAQCFFGYFDGTKLVGITGVVTAREDASGRTALFIASYLQPAYRGRGIAALFYKARFDWVREQPRIDRIVVSHRASNEPSRRAILGHGFVETGRALRRWPDGATDDEVLYEIRLQRGR